MFNIECKKKAVPERKLGLGTRAGFRDGAGTSDAATLQPPALGKTKTRVPKNRAFCFALVGAAAVILGAAPAMYAQTGKLDSLEKVASSNVGDAEKAKALCGLCAELKEVGRMDESLEKGKAGLALAEKSQDPHALGGCHNALGVYAMEQGEYDAALAHYQAAARHFEKLNMTLKALKVEENVAVVWAMRGEFAQSLKVYTKCLEAYKNTGDKRQIARTLQNIANVHTNQGEYSKALEFYRQSLELSEAVGYDRLTADLYSNMGIVHEIQGRYPMALDFEIKGMKIREKLNDRVAVAASCLNIGNIYTLQERMDEALEYYLKAYAIGRESNDQGTLPAILINIGKIYCGKGRREECWDYCNRALEAAVSIGDLKGKAEALSSLGNLHAELDRPKEAVNFLEQALAIIRELQSPEDEALTLSMLSHIKRKQGLNAEARTQAKQGLEIAQRIQSVNAIKEAAHSLYMAENALGNHKAALESYIVYHAYSDSMKNDEQSQKIGLVEGRYEAEKMMEEEKRKSEEAAARQAEEQQRIYTFQSYGIFAFLLLAFFSLFFLGKFNVPVWALKTAMYVSLITAFEFALMMFEPLNERFSQGTPVYQLVFNTCLGIGLWPVHAWAEQALKRKLLKSGNPQGLQKW